MQIIARADVLTTAEIERLRYRIGELGDANVFVPTRFARPADHSPTPISFAVGETLDSTLVPTDDNPGRKIDRTDPNIGPRAPAETAAGTKSQLSRQSSRKNVNTGHETPERPDLAEIESIFPITFIAPELQTDRPNQHDNPRISVAYPSTIHSYSRVFRYGTADPLNPEHCEFVPFRDLLLASGWRVSAAWLKGPRIGDGRTND